MRWIVGDRTPLVAVRRWTNDDRRSLRRPGAVAVDVDGAEVAAIDRPQLEPKHGEASGRCGDEHLTDEHTSEIRHDDRVVVNLRRGVRRPGPLHRSDDGGGDNIVPPDEPSRARGGLAPLR